MSDSDPWTDVLGYTDLGTERREVIKEEIKELVQNLPQDHPGIFEAHDVSARDYSRNLDTAIHSLDGTIKAKRGKDNEDVVREVFLGPGQEAGLLEFTDQRGSERIDFKGTLATGDTFAMDVKGGEGQSIGHLLVPSNTDVLSLWSERNSRNTKSPASRLNEVINRAVRWSLNQSEDLSVMVVRDEPAGARTDEGEVIPDVVVFPEEFPTPENPNPSMPDIDDLEYARIVFEILTGNGDLSAEETRKHIWWHELEYRHDEGKIDKRIYNDYDDSITLTTQSIEFERISDVS
ncbi:hypothetical protein [Halorubrum tebenquichense]|uniref:Uncharacterized protein n=1 Tax=Halorubrum tebenquichense DSM 14210 TaxID=1227485 RepID=M0DY74_9EURY|nr:hypothetical protein [Halorubrum tebenquichense]ELZ39763.1 hypothetical protein C472_03029 [Halorubrum tebenquichense DSM 14210]